MRQFSPGLDQEWKQANDGRLFMRKAWKLSNVSRTNVELTQNFRRDEFQMSFVQIL